jgi:hypothetical protein
VSRCFRHSGVRSLKELKDKSVMRERVSMGEREVSHTDELLLVHDIPLSTVHLLSCAFFASSTPALGSGTPLTWVASSTVMFAWCSE